MITDTNAISSDLECSPRRIGKAHLVVLAAIATLAAAATLLLWFHPTLGYARGGILDGADLRGSMIQVLWCAFLGFATASTLVMGLLSPRVGAGARSVLAYGIASTLLVVVGFPLLDSYY